MKSILKTIIILTTLIISITVLSSCNEIVRDHRNYSDGLEYSLKSDGTYSVSGIGSCTDTDIYIPEIYNGKAVTSIDEMAFYGRMNPSSITIPDSVTSIGEGAFKHCSGLTSVTIGNSVTSIGKGAFSHCTRLTSVYITDIKSWCETNFYDFDSNPLHYAESLYLNGELVTDLVIPDSVTSIGNFAFVDCIGLTSVAIPDSVISIGEDAFLDCEGLKSVTIGNSVTSIGGSAFENCKNLKSVYITDIKSWCEIDFGDDSSSSNPLRSAGNLYLNGELVTDLVIPDSVTSIGNFAFLGCTSLTEVTIPDSVTSIGEGAFACANLTSVYITDIKSWCKIDFGDDGLSNPLRIAGNLYLNGELVTDLVIPEGVTSIGSFAFSNCTSLTEVTIPDSVTSIGYGAFYKCTSLTSVTIPDSVTSIGNMVFLNCTNLIEVIIPDSVTSIGGSAFSSCTSLTSITIPDSVTSIGYGAFENCTNLKSVHITDIKSWCEIDFGDFVSNPLHYEGNLYLNRKLVTDLVIPDGVTSIDRSAFEGCTSLTSITITDSVTSIGESAFSRCTSLTSVTIPDSVTSIGEYTFSWCESLTEVTIPDSVTSIGYGAFIRCENLASITFNGTVEEWDAIEKDSSWNYNVPAKEVICSDGKVALE